MRFPANRINSIRTTEGVNPMRKLFALALLFACGLANAQVAQLQAFAPNGNTITFTAAVSGAIPTPVQATTPAGQSYQYIVTNIGTVTAFISWGSSATATANCVIPTGTSQSVVPILPSAAFVITLPANVFFCGITASGTAIIYVTPGVGT